MKIRRSYISIALIVLVVQTGMAQEQKRDSLDTGKVYEIGEVVVTGTRNETDVRHLSQTVSVVNRSEIDQALQPSLLPVLTEQIRTIDKRRLREHMGRLDAAMMNQVDNAIAVSFGLPKGETE